MLILWCQVMVGTSLNIKRVLSPPLGYARLVYRPFRYILFSLVLTKSPNLRWHKRTFVDRVNWSGTNPAGLGIIEIGAKLILWYGLGQRLLVLSNNSWGILTLLTAFFLRITLCRKIWLTWRRRGSITASTFSYTNNQSIFTSSCAVSLFKLVIAGATDRKTCLNASLLELN